MKKNNFEETHNLYIVEDINTDSLATTIDVKHNTECLDKVLDCYEHLSTTIDVKHNIECLNKMVDCVDKILENI